MVVVVGNMESYFSFQLWPQTEQFLKKLFATIAKEIIKQLKLYSDRNCNTDKLDATKNLTEQCNGLSVSKEPSKHYNG